MAQGKITYNIDFNVNTTTLNNATKSLQSLSRLTMGDFQFIKPQDTEKAKAELAEIQRAAKIAGEALQDSFNPKLNTVNVDTFMQKISASNLSLSQLSSAMAKAGPTGERAFRDVAMAALNTSTTIKSTNKVLDELGKTMGNTIRWHITSTALNAITSSIQDVWSYAKKLDTSLNDIRIVTSKSADEMERFALEANKAAKSLGASTTSYTNASLIYYQQGLGERDVRARTDVTLKAANVTGQSAAEVSEQLTAVWNGYKVVAEEAELYVDKLAAVAATTAADLEELSTGMQKVASAANTMGVDIDQLSAQLATIVSVTRQDASLVGTALKTIYARMGDLKVDGVDEFGTSLGDVSGQMRQMGIDVLDQEGNLRDMGNVIEEVAAKWGTWTDAQQQAAAVAMAGKRQYNNLIALFENWDMYESALATSQGAEGTLQKQQKIYMDSLEAKLQELATSAEALKNALFDSDSTKAAIDGLSGVLELATKLVNTIGGGGNLLMLLGSTALRVFSSQIGGGLTSIFTKLGLIRAETNTLRAELSVFDDFEAEAKKHGEAYRKLLDMKKEELKYQRLLTAEQKEQAKIILNRTAVLENDKEDEKANITTALSALGYSKNPDTKKSAYEKNNLRTQVKETEQQYLSAQSRAAAEAEAIQAIEGIRSQQKKILGSASDTLDLQDKLFPSNDNTQKSKLPWKEANKKNKQKTDDNILLRLQGKTEESYQDAVYAAEEAGQQAQKVEEQYPKKTKKQDKAKEEGSRQHRNAVYEGQLLEQKNTYNSLSAQEQSILSSLGFGSYDDLKASNSNTTSVLKDREKKYNEAKNNLQEAENAEFKLVGTGVDHLVEDETAESLYANLQSTKQQLSSVQEQQNQIESELPKKQEVTTNKEKSLAQTATSISEKENRKIELEQQLLKGAAPETRNNKLNELAQLEKELIQLKTEEKIQQEELNQAQEEQRALEEKQVQLALEKMGLTQTEVQQQEAFDIYRKGKNIVTVDEATAQFDDTINASRRISTDLQIEAQKAPGITKAELDEFKMLDSKNAADMSEAELNRYNKLQEKSESQVASNTATMQVLTDNIDNASLDKDSQSDLNNLMLDYSEVLSKVSKETALSGEEQATYNQFLKKAQGIIDDNTERLEDNKQALLDGVAAAQQTDKTSKENEKSWKDFTKSINTKALVSNISGLIGSVGSLASAFTMLSTVKDIWGSEDLSSWEKLTQTIATSVPMLGMFASGFKGVFSAVTGVSGALLGQASILGTLSTIQKAKSLADKQTAIDEWAKAAGAQKFAVTEGMGTTAILGQMMASKIKSVVDKMQLTGTFAQVAANIALTASMTPMLVITLAIIAALAILAVIILSIVAVVKAFQQATDNGKKSLEEAAKTATAATEEFNRVKTAFEELKQSLANYNDAQKAIEEMTAGTQEWKDAIADANNQVLDLIDKYPELAQYVSSVDGQLVLSQEGQEAVLEAEEKRVAVAEAASLAAKQAELEAKNNAIVLGASGEDLNADAKATGGLGKILGGIALSGASVQAGMGMIISGIVDQQYAKDADKGYANAVDIINSQGVDILNDQDAFTEALKDAGTTNKDVIAALWENSESLRQNAAEINANTQAMSIMQKQAADSYLKANYTGYDDLSLKEQSLLSSAMARRADSIEVQSKGDEVRKGLYGNNDKLNKRELKEVGKQYAELMGIDYTSLEVDKKTKEITFKAADGSTQAINGDAAALALIEQAELGYAMNEVNVETLVQAIDRMGDKMVDKFGEIGSNMSKALSSFAQGGNFEDLTKSELEKFTSGLQGYDGAIADYNKALDAANKKVDKKDSGWSRFWGGYGRAVDERDALLEEGADGVDKAYEHFGYSSREEFQADIEAMGYESEEAFIEAVRVQQKATQKEWDKLGVGLSATVTNAFESIDATGKSLSFMQDIELGLSNAFQKGGAEGLTAFTNVINSGAIKEEDFESFNSIFSTIDWAAAGAVETFTQELEKAGIVINPVSGAWSDFLIKMAGAENTVQNVTNNLTALRETLKSISETVKELSLGDIISDEDYAELIAKNKELSKYFIMTADGYAFIGGANFQEEVKKAQNNTLNIDAIKKDFAEAQVEAKGLINNSDYFDDGEFINSVAQDEFLQKITSGSYDSFLAATGLSPDLIKEAQKEVTNENVLQYKGKTAKEVADAEGITTEEAQKRITDANERYSNAEAILNDAATKALSALHSMESGEWDKLSTDAQTAAITGQVSNYRELVELNREYGKTHGTSKNIIDTEAYNKLARMYLSQEATELGLYFSEEMLANSDNFNRLNGLILDARQLELDILKETEWHLTKIESSMERAFGADRIRLLNQQAELLEKQYVLTQEQQESAQKVFAANLIAAQNVTSADLWDESTGTFNYQAALTAQLQASTADEQNALEAVINSYETVMDLEQQSIDISQSIIDAQVETLTYQKELAEEYKEFVQEWKEFNTNYSDFFASETTSLADLFGDKFFKSLGNLATKYSVDDIEADSNNYSNWLGEAGWTGSTFDITQSKFYDEGSGQADVASWQEFVSSTLSEGANIFAEYYDYANELYNEILSANEELLAIYDDQIEKLNNLNSLIKDGLELYKLMASTSSSSYYNNVSAYTNQIRANITSTYELAENEYDKALTAYNSLSADADASIRESAAQALATANANRIAALQEALSLTAEIFGTELTAAIDSAFVEATGMTLNNFSSDWSREKDLDAMYLDATNSTYEMNKMLRDFDKSIDETDNITAQNKLVQARADAESRLNAIIAERGKLSQYELDRENALFDITLKQIALEEAQRTASQMKLTRDAFGNYSYQYTADEENIAEAEAELAEASNKLYNLNKTKTSELIDTYQAEMQEFVQAYTDAVATGDNAIIDAVVEQYLGENGVLTLLRGEMESLSGLELNTPFDDYLEDLLEVDLGDILTKTTALTANVKGDVTSITTAIQDVFKEGGSFETAIGNLQTAVDTASTILDTEANQALTNFNSAVDTLNTVVNSSAFKSFGENLATWATSYSTWVNSAMNLETSNNNLQTPLDKNTDALENLTDTIDILNVKLTYSPPSSPPLNREGLYQHYEEGGDAAFTIAAKGLEPVPTLNK